MREKAIYFCLINSFICWFLFLLICLSDVTNWKLDSNNLKAEINDIYKTIKVNEKEESDKTVIVNQDTNLPKSDPYWDYIKMNLIDVDFKELKKVNSDTKGWIQVNGTNINYPFVQTVDNDYYLNHTFNKTITQGISVCPENAPFAPVGMWSESQCGRKLHIDGDVLYMHREPATPTEHQLYVRVKDDIYSANMTIVPTFMNRDSTRFLKILYNSTEYYVCDDTTYKN